VCEGGEQGGLAETHAGGARAKVQLGRRRDAHRPLPEGDAVQVLLENRLFVEMGVEAKGPEDLAELARKRARRASQQAHELHRDRRASRDHTPRSNVEVQCARQRSRVHAGMDEIAVIFDGQECLEDLGVQLVERRPAPSAATVGPRDPQRHTMAVEQHQSRYRARMSKRVRQGQGNPCDNRDDADQRDAGSDAGATEEGSHVDLSKIVRVASNVGRP
jgi:hypothetical protein